MLRSRAGSRRKLFLLGAALGAALVAGPARAGDNDVLLWKLGHPDPIVICTLCNGTDNMSVPGDPNAQKRFAELTSSLGLAFVPGFGEAAGSAGQSGFEIGYSQSVRFLSLEKDAWATDGSAGTATPGTSSTFAQQLPILAISTLTVRKGIGGSFDLGTFISYMAESSMLAVGAELRASLVDGIDYAPDVAIRAYGARITGSRELDLTIAGADLMISKSFAAAGMIKLQPYGQYGMAFINANTGVIDFNPGSMDASNPTAEDGVFNDIHMFSNRYNRFAFGLRMVAGAAIVGLEMNYAFGTNPVQAAAFATGIPASAQTQTTHEVGIDAHLGVQF